MEFIQFIFSNFWIFVGFLMLITAVLEGIEAIIRAIKK